MLTRKEQNVIIILPKGNRRKPERRAMEEMNMQENARLVLGLRAAGWDEKKINDFLLYIETGEEQYKPKPDETK